VDPPSPKVWDGETGRLLADLRGGQGEMVAVAVWEEHTTSGHEHHRIATSDNWGKVKVWDLSHNRKKKDFWRHPVTYAEPLPKPVPEPLPEPTC
jgi:hypothetical protein